MDLIIEIVGWSAAGVLLGAYALLSRGRLSGQGSSFQVLNVVGSLLVGINSFVHEAWPSVSVNAVWLVIGIVTLAAGQRRARPAASLPGTTASGRRHADAAHSSQSDPGWPGLRRGRVPFAARGRVRRAGTGGKAS